MAGTMEIPTEYRTRVAGYEAQSGIQCQGAPRDDSVFYESPTAFIRRVHVENGIGAVVAPQVSSLSGVEDRVERELRVFERALHVLTGGRPAQARIRELREQAEGCVVAQHIYHALQNVA